jgi:hypothetical protein
MSGCGRKVRPASRNFQGHRLGLDPRALSPATGAHGGTEADGETVPAFPLVRYTTARIAVGGGSNTLARLLRDIGYSVLPLGAPATLSKILAKRNETVCAES